MEDLTRLVKTSLDRYIQISTQSGPSKVSYFAPLVEAFWDFYKFLFMLNFLGISDYLEIEMNYKMY